MPQYHYKIFNEKGQIHFGHVDATDYAEARRKLKDQKNVVIVEIRSHGEGMFRPFKRALAAEQELFFFIQFATLLANDVPILKALEIITPQIKDSGFRNALEISQKDIQKGASLSEALQKHERYFPGMALGMIEAGEESGTLDVVFRQLGTYVEQKGRLRHELVTAGTYPCLLFFTAFLVCVVMVIFVYPLFLEIFSANEVVLPLATRLVAGGALWLQHHWLYLAGAFLLILAFAYRYLTTAEGQAALDRALQRVPWIGGIIRQYLLHQLFFNLGLLLNNGVPLLKSIELLAKTLTNITMTQLLADVWVTLRQGGAMSDAVRKHEELPPLVHQMVLVGEQTGKLGNVAHELSVYFETLTGRHLKRLTLILEPALLFSMGILVTFLMTSLLLPMFQMARAIR